jgi:RNA polymerase sigma-70 factor (ECF subfamily)
LCGAYWYPLYAYLRRKGQTPHDAQDLTQAFFAHLLEKKSIERANPEKGRFRCFLLGALNKFVAGEQDKARAQKRGGDCVLISLDEKTAEQRFLAEPIQALDPQKLYERRWAMTLLNETVERLQAEFAAAGREQEFELLKEWLTADRGSIPYAQLGQALSINEGAARVAVHRLRKRFRAFFRQTIAETVGANEDVDSEMRHLVGVLSRA